MKWNAYWRLMRFNKPAGIFLLWYPSAWALWFANQGMPPVNLLILFLMGTILMRAAGCVINDLADRHIDKHVARTKLRPLTSGEVSLKEALIVLTILLLGALLVVSFLNRYCFYIALVALLITCIYPFCKRFFDAPQFMLGLAFSCGIPMAYVASDASLNGQFWFLFLLNFLWIVSYDTIYAMADKADDMLIGVRSTALYLGNYDRLVIGLLQLMLQILWLSWGLYKEVNLWFYPLWIASGCILIYQQHLISKRLSEDCFKAFVCSIYYGMILWIAVVLSF